MRLNLRLLALLCAAAGSIQAATLVASIYGAYDAAGMSVLPTAVRNDANTANHYGDSNVYDTPSLFFVNPTDYGITGAQMSLAVNLAANSGQNTFNNGVTRWSRSAR